MRRILWNETSFPIKHCQKPNKSVYLFEQRCGFWCCVKKICLNFQPITHPSQSHNNAIRGTTVTLRCWSSHCTMETESVEFAGTSATAEHIVPESGVWAFSLYVFMECMYDDRCSNMCAICGCFMATSAFTSFISRHHHSMQFHSWENIFELKCVKLRVCFL